MFAFFSSPASSYLDFETEGEMQQRVHGPLVATDTGIIHWIFRGEVRLGENSDCSRPARGYFFF